MLNVELIDYINNQKKPLNKGQLFDIGLKHKQLTEGKDWSELVERLGLKIKGDSFRRWINNQMKEVAEKAEDTSKDVTLTSFEEIYKERTKVRDAWNAYRGVLRDGARLESFYQGVSDAIKELPPINIVDSFSKNRWNDLKTIKAINEKEAVLLFSDMHIGVKCSNFYNQYNSEIAKARVESLVEDVVDYCQNNDVTKLNVINLGDMIHGAIHTNARLEQEFDVIKQITTASEIIAQALVCLKEAAPILTYRSVIDNHSRLLSNKEDSIDAENLGRLIDFYLETRLQNTGIVFMHDNLDDGLGMFELENGKKFAFAHGHQDNVNSCLQNICGATQSFVDYFAIGHLHSNKFKEFQGMSLFVNGSICGTEQYALGKRLFNKASQRLLIFDYTDNVMDIKINLQPDIHLNNKKFDS